MRGHYPNAAHAIRQRIASQNLRPGTILPATRALAAELGFHPAAVARACNVLIGAGVLARKGYKMSVGAGGLSAPAMQGTIEVVSYFDGFLRAAGRILTERGISHHLTELSWTQHPHPDPVLRKILAKKPAGMIFSTTCMVESTKSLLQRIGLPMVICADGDPVLNHSSFQTDLYRGTEKAIKHLAGIGHRHIALVSFPDSNPEWAESFRAVCLKLDLEASSGLVWRPETRDEVVLLETISEELRRHPVVTALFCELSSAVMVSRNFNVPQELSVVGMDTRGLAHRHPLTALTTPDFDCIALSACTEIISQVQVIQSGRPRRPATHALFIPDLVLRKSTRAVSAQPAAAEPPGKSTAPRTNPRSTWLKIYPSLKKIRSPRWRPLDLARLANHSMTRQNGWLGSDPLLHFCPGLPVIHGVPFQVLDEKQNGGRAVVTFRSPHAHSAGRKRLPDKARIQVCARVKALYFLHGCGYAQPHPFASYTMRYQGGASISVPLAPLGHSRRVAQRRLQSLQPNIQDWWPEFRQGHFPHAHHALVCNPADPAAYRRSLYSLEWINPQPREELSHVEVRVDPEFDPTLALIAVTALLCSRSGASGRESARPGNRWRTAAETDRSGV